MREIVRDAGYVVPTRVGVNRGGGGLAAGGGGCPHARGGEPLAEFLRDLLQRLSPRAWG